MPIFVDFSGINQTHGLFSTSCKPFLVGLRTRFKSSPAQIYRTLCKNLSLVKLTKKSGWAIVADSLLLVVQ